MKVTRFIILLAAMMWVLAPGVASAQDPVKVAPQDYKVLLENDHVRVLEITVKAGAKEAMHSHPAYVLYFMSDGKGKYSFPDGSTKEIEGKAGQTVWGDPVTHAFENTGGDVHALMVEMKGPHKRMQKKAEEPKKMEKK